MPSALQQHLGRRGPAVVGHRHRGRVGAGLADRDQVAAPERRQAWRSKVSVLSQIGPSTRASAVLDRWRRRPGAARRPAGRARSGRGSDGCAPYSAGRMSSVMPVSRTTIARLRALADVEHARHEPARPRHEEAPRLDASRAGRRSGGRASTSAGSLPAEVLGRRHGRPARRPGSRRRRRACRTPGARRRSGRAPRARAGRRRATRPPRPAASRRGGGSRAQRSGPSARRRPDRAGQLGLGHAELRGPAPDREAGVASRASTSGLRRSRTSSAAPAARPARAGAAASSASSSGLSTATQRSGSPPAAGADRRPQVRVGLADALERDPVVRDPGPPRHGPLAARDDVRAQPGRAEPRDDRRARRSP